jgi:putative RNA 2'-phosphotransferase
MDISRAREQLAGFLAYILGRNPYEFGLVPDENGYVKIKEILRVFSEEDGWSHVRQSSLDELIIALADPGVEITDGLIRSKNRENLTIPVYKDIIPKLLYVGIRKTAHVHVAENGINPNDSKPFVILSSDKAMAERIAKRKDPLPVVLTVNTSEAKNLGVLFLHAGETLFLASEIPLNCFSGPPLPSPEDERSWTGKKKTPDRKMPPTPGSFFPDFGDKPRDQKQKNGKNDKVSWKHNKKKLRKQKENFRGDY